MPIPKPPMSDGETQARMQRALSAWRQIAVVVRGVSRAAAEGKQDSLASSILNDLESVANAFDAWPSAWSHIQDLRAEIERLELNAAPALASRTVETSESCTRDGYLILPDLERQALCKHGNPEATVYCPECMKERPGGPCGRCGGPTLDVGVDALCPVCDPPQTRDQVLEEAKGVYERSKRSP